MQYCIWRRSLISLSSGLIITPSFYLHTSVNLVSTNRSTCLLFLDLTCDPNLMMRDVSLTEMLIPMLMEETTTIKPPHAYVDLQRCYLECDGRKML